jgi:hypothetical protein
MTDNSDESPTLEEVLDGEVSADEYNRHKEAEMEARLNQLDEQKQAAVGALRDAAQESADTETVTIGQIDLEVVSRIPPAVEDLLDEMERAEQRQDTDRLRELNALALAEMVDSPDEYADPDVWAVAAEQNGLQWVSEAVATVLGPARDRQQDTAGNLEPDSDNTPNQQRGKPSGWQRQR